jgi:hypothetical protein
MTTFKLTSEEGRNLLGNDLVNQQVIVEYLSDESYRVFEMIKGVPWYKFRTLNRLIRRHEMLFAMWTTEAAKRDAILDRIEAKQNSEGE